MTILIPMIAFVSLLLGFWSGIFFGAWIYANKETLINKPVEKLNKTKIGEIIDDKTMKKIEVEDAQKRAKEEIHEIESM